MSKSLSHRFHLLGKTFLALVMGLMFLPTATQADAVTDMIAKVEADLGGRVGVSILDTATNKRWQHNADERFPFNSTFKTLACASLLSRVDQGNEALDKHVVFDKNYLVSYSPVTTLYVGEKGMSLDAICGAAMNFSDNSAANLVLDTLGGPTALTVFMRSIGDEVSRLDRKETALNQATPGDVRDTTTPNAMVANLNKLVLGDVLSKASRNKLKAWLTGNQTSGALIRSAVPAGWTVGDRTGAGGYGSRSITAIIWPPARKPIIAAIYITETSAPFAARNKAIADIGAVLVTVISGE